MQHYDLIIIGGGVGGLVTASGAAQLGAKVALVEKEALGGDCLHYGCVPTKRLVESARLAHRMRRAAEFGIEPVTVNVNFNKVMQSVRDIQKKLGVRDEPARFEEMGIRVIIGTGEFKDSETFVVNRSNEELKGRRFLIATGSSAILPPIPGLKEAKPLTNITMLELKSLPHSMTILGAGPIAIEYAQIFSRLGTEVTVILRKDRILSKEDREVADTLEEVLTKEGITFIKEATVSKISIDQPTGGIRVLNIKSPDGETILETEEVLAALGQSPNTAGLNLEAAGIDYDKAGIKVDEHLMTTAKHIYACGDVAGKYKFTHVAEYEASIVITNALFPLLNRKADYTVVPWVTFTEPELARVGLTEAEAREKYGDEVKVYRHWFKENDRAIIEGNPEGLVKVIVDKKKKIVGAHIVGPNAGEFIHEFTLAMSAGLPVTKLSQTIHAYPTVAQGVKRAADEYYREKLFTGWVPKLAKRFANKVD